MRHSHRVAQTPGSPGRKLKAIRERGAPSSPAAVLGVVALRLESPRVVAEGVVLSGFC